MPEDVKEVVFELGAYMLMLAGITKSLEEAKQLLEQKIIEGSAYNKFVELIQNQEGDISYIQDLEKFKKARYIEPVYSKKSGYIQNIDAKEVGKLACSLGAGRITKEDKIQEEVGIILDKKVGSYVKEGEVLAYIHTNNENTIEEDKAKLLQIIEIGMNEITKNKTILEIIK